MKRRGGHAGAVRSVGRDACVASGPDPVCDLEAYVWFDRDSEGPFALATVESFVAANPVRYGAEFHITGRPDLSYEVLLPERYARHVAAHRR